MEDSSGSQVERSSFESISSLASSTAHMPGFPKTAGPDEAKAYRQSLDSIDGLNDVDTEPQTLKTRLRNLIIAMFKKNLGVKLMIVAQLFGSAMAATTRMLEISTVPPLHPTQVLFARMTITHAACIAYMLYTKQPDPLLGPRGIRLLLNLRGMLGFFGVFGFYYSLLFLQLSDAIVLTFLSPTVTGFLAWVMLGEVFGSIEMIGGFVSLFGVMVISRPSFLFHSNTTDEVAPPAGRMLGVLMSMVGIGASALCFVVIRKIGHRAHPLISVAYFSWWCWVVSGVAMLAVPGLKFVLPSDLKQWLLLLSLGVFGFLFQFMLTAAIQREKASVIVSINYTGILWALMWERLLWGRVPDLWSWVGGGLILGSALWMAYRKHMIGREAAKADEADAAVDADAGQALMQDEEAGIELEDA